MKNEFEEDIKVIVNHFDEKLKSHGGDVKSLSWGSEGSQQTRFQILSEIGDLNQKSVLDVGCGFGDLYSFLCNKRGFNLERYVGVDLNPKMVQEAKRKYPQTEFEVKDILENPIGSFDYVMSSGIFSLKTPKWKDMTYDILSAMYALCKRGIAVNFLSKFTPFEKEGSSYYADPMEILEFVYKNLSKKVVLRHDYRPNDFTLYVYR